MTSLAGTRRTYSVKIEDGEGSGSKPRGCSAPRRLNCPSNMLDTTKAPGCRLYSVDCYTRTSMHSSANHHMSVQRIQVESCCNLKKSPLKKVRKPGMFDSSQSKASTRY